MTTTEGHPCVWVEGKPGAQIAIAQLQRLFPRFRAQVDPRPWDEVVDVVLTDTGFPMRRWAGSNPHRGLDLYEVGGRALRALYPGGWATP